MVAPRLKNLEGLLSVEVDESVSITHLLAASGRQSLTLHLLIHGKKDLAALFLFFVYGEAIPLQKLIGHDALSPLS